MRLVEDGTGATAGDGIGQRERILDIALRLMSEGGVHAMSMRRLADACGLNVATIYHYFPSKAALLTEVIDQRSYEELLDLLPPIDVTQAPRERLCALLMWIWSSMGDQEDMWRLLLGESLRSEPLVMQSAARLSDVFEHALERWLAELFADVPLDRPRVARVLRGVVYGVLVEQLPIDPANRDGLLEGRAADVAAVLIAQG